MSRETDSSSSGPQGRGGAAYPSGTPPYGTRRYADGATAGADGEPKPDGAKSEPKTETTITTRIRINIPGSRPIPPVVMRKPANEGDTAAPDAPAASAGPPGGGPAVPEAEAERTAAMPVASFDGPAPADAPDAQAGKPSSDWFAPRKSSTNGAGLAVTAAAQGSPPGGSGAPNGAGQQTGPGPQNGFAAPGGGPDGRAPVTPPPPRSSLSDLAGAGPDGPTTGPASGALSVPPAARTAPDALPARRTQESRAAGAVAAPPRMSDDTAVLTPQRPVPEPADGPGSAAAPAGHVSGDTLTSGVPAVRPDAESPFPAGPGAPGAPGSPGSAGGLVGPGVKAPAPAPRPAPAPPAKKKGRSKLVLLGVGLVAVAGIAYGAGLLLNHSDVPKSTTVLGVDIGGGTHDEAVGKLEGTLGKRSALPLQLSVAGKKIPLAPDKAGLSLDAQTTVRNAAGSDYNPMSVIGSLFGGERVAQPEIVIDEEKLRSALGDLAGGSGSAVESRITFEPGEVVVVPGKAGQGLDVDRSLNMIKDAYRAQIESGRTNAVELPVTERQPSVTAAELARAKREFADVAMSGLITIKAGGREIDFGPNRSLPRILSMKPVDGRLVEVYDKEAITELVGSTFQGVLITKGDGKQHQLTADDIAYAMGPALRGKTPEERTAVIDLDPS
ncbi:hypothetical protein ABZ714_33430 [Streptomyces sp. NPDC006798]|uniref:peptidoglycan binding domain-containing protein n=1 Tax=Streptomyces sp. NPDC006798 TaxID=3155462 RepID=UPI0033CFF838